MTGADQEVKPLPITENSTLPDGDILKDDVGKQYIKIAKQQGWMELAPFVDGKPQVNAYSVLKVALDAFTKEAHPNWRTMSRSPLKV